MACVVLPVNYFDQADITVSPSAVATMLVTNMQSNVRPKAWRSTSLATQTISGDWDGDTRPVSAWLLMPGSSSMIGSQVQVKLWSDLAKTALVYDSGAVDFLDFSGEGWGEFAWGAHPWGVDPAHFFAQRTPAVRYFSRVAARAFEIIVTYSTGMAAGFFELSRAWLADYVEAPYNAMTGASFGWESNSSHQRTPGAALHRQARDRWLRFRCEIMLDSEEERARWHGLMWACDPGREVVFSFYQSTGRQGTDFTIMGSLTALNPLVNQALNIHKLQLEIVES